MNRKARGTRTHFANQPSMRKKRDYDATNDLAARVILADTRKHTGFQVRWVAHSHGAWLRRARRR